MGGTRRFMGMIGLLIGGGALGLALAGQPSDHSSEVADALFIAELNEDSAESAPQQQVVNGWVARDLMEIQTRQLDDLSAAVDRTQWLLGGIALLLGVVALTTALDGRRDAATSTTVGLQTVATPPPLTEPATD